MGFSFRKQIKLGKGINLNLSKSGVGVSFGKKGFRITRQADGKQYVNIGKGGISYKKSIGGKSRKSKKSDNNILSYAIAPTMIFIIIAMNMELNQKYIIAGAVVIAVLGLIYGTARALLSGKDSGSGN